MAETEQVRVNLQVKTRPLNADGLRELARDSEFQRALREAVEAAAASVRRSIRSRHFCPSRPKRVGGAPPELGPLEGFGPLEE